MEKKKLITALMVCCMAVLPASAEIVNDDIINQTITGQSSASSGGVAHNEIGNTMTIENSTFTGNNGAYTGGVWNQGELIITDGKETEHTTFDGNSNNSSWGGGGAIYSYEAGSSVYVGDYTSFAGNHSNNDQGGDAGGAIYMGDSTLKIGDYVYVPVRETSCPAIVENIEKFSYRNVPFPLNMTKTIIRKSSKNEFEDYNRKNVNRGNKEKADPGFPLPQNGHKRKDSRWPPGSLPSKPVHRHESCPPPILSMLFR